MGKDSDNLINACVAYVEARDIHYIAKDGLLVYLTSSTGRKADLVWNKLTLTEAIRVVKATRLSPDANLKDSHLIAALQELGRVYEYSTRSRYKVKEEVFNFNEHTAGATMGESIMHQLGQALHNMDTKSFYLTEVVELMTHIQESLDVGLSTTEIRDLVYKFFEGMGYIIKTGSNRPLVRGSRHPVIMAPKSRPKDVTSINELRQHIAKRIIEDLR